MRWTKRPLLVLIGGLIVAGGVFLFSRDRIVLNLTNLDHPQTLSFHVRPGERFYLYYTHSMYDQPVTEEFEVVADEIILRGVRTTHAGVMEYYGFDEVLEFHELNKGVGSAFLIRSGMRPGQGIILRGEKISLYDIGERGDRIRVSVSKGSVGRQCFDLLRAVWER